MHMLGVGLQGHHRILKRWFASAGAERRPNLINRHCNVTSHGSTLMNEADFNQVVGRSTLIRDGLKINVGGLNVVWLFKG